MQGVIPNSARCPEDRSKDWPKQDASASFPVLGDHRACNPSATLRAVEQGKSRMVHVVGPDDQTMSVDDQHGINPDTGEPIIQRVIVTADGTTTVTYFESDGVTPLPQSTPFSPTQPNTKTAIKFATDTVTGAYRELTVETDVTNSTVTYFDANGVETTLGANEVVRDYIVAVPLGNEIINVAGGTPATLTVPANAEYAYMNVNGTDAMYAHGAAPVANVDHRVADGGRIELQSADRLASFQLDALDGATAFATRVYYYNVNPDTTSRS